MGKKIGIIGHIGNAVETVILSRVKNNSLYNEYHKRSEKGAPWKRQAQTMEKKEIEDLTKSIMSATDPENPRRGELMRFYKSMNTDLHLGSCVDNRILPIQCAKYNLVDKDGNADEEAKRLLEKPWFLELARLVVKSTFEGTTLIELFELNEKGEIKEVIEIPQGNFLAHKGIIVNEEWDENGVSYKEGKYSNYYVQIGNDWSLGLYAQIGLIVIAKKLGLGSWLSYIDKFGVPPVFAITERMDTTRRDELYDMLVNFRMNHFAVLQGSEKIEIPNNYNVDAYKSFSSLNEYADSLMSKRLLGGTGTTDEKSYVGSAEVHERLLVYRNKVDKLLFRYYFNEEIKPRLIKLSSVYAPFENLSFEYDEKESLTLTGILKAIKDLSQHYEFDLEELVKVTGLPITKLKAAVDKTTTETTSQKKNPDANGQRVVSPQAQTEVYELFAATWDKAIDRLANDIYDGKVKTTDLDKDLVLKNYAAFNKEAQKAWGKGYYDESITRQFRENILQFAGAKAHDLMKQLDGLNTGKTKKEDFINQAKGIVNKHNEQWLSTEAKFAGDCVSSAQEYASYIKDVDIYQNMKYRTMGDGEVRNSHAANEGLIIPVNEVTALAPFDYGCRCWWEQTTEKPTSGKTIKGVKFSNNPYKTGKVFNEEQSYFQNIVDKKRGIIRDNTELMKQHMPYQTITVDEQTVHVNDFYDLSDGTANIKAAKKLAVELEQDIYILPHIENSAKLHRKNPEMAIGKTSYTADLKTFNPDVASSTRKFVANGVNTANKQGCKAVVLDISKAPEADCLKIAATKLRGELNGIGKANIKKVVVIKDNMVIIVTRKQLAQKNYQKYFEVE
ncbi:DUF935 family protein [Labilibaculum sp.]|uniref:phage portal protein family protein n=1 Tax=Labilibaculum sp. TaxID=2060723 RepID=UPI002AA6AC50|nr:DUF935 family protein [Labilibaculum sp.]